MDLGYARVSTTKQDLEQQLDALTRAGVPVERIYVDKQSGPSTDRPGLAALLDYVRPGDVIVVHTLDRLGRTVRDTLNLIHDLTERKVGLRNLADPVKVDTTDPGDLMGQLAIVLLALFAQMERTYTLERVAHARSVAEATGRRPGRPPTVDASKLAWAVQLRDVDGLSVDEIVEKTKIPRSSLYRHLPPRPAPAVTADGRPAAEAGARPAGPDPELNLEQASSADAAPTRRPPAAVAETVPRKVRSIRPEAVPTHQADLERRRDAAAVAAARTVDLSDQLGHPTGTWLLVDAGEGSWHLRHDGVRVGVVRRESTTRGRRGWSARLDTGVPLPSHGDLAAATGSNLWRTRDLAAAAIARQSAPRKRRRRSPATE